MVRAVALTRSVGELVGRMREHVIQPRKQPVWVAVGSNWVAERVRSGCVEAVAGRDGAAEDANGCVGKYGGKRYTTRVRLRMRYRSNGTDGLGGKRETH